jgi:indolepyruvate ferredoxin oxidoreductase beta subunit
LGEADLILSLEPMESLRYLPYLSIDGWIITNTTPFVNIPNYPGMGELLSQLRSYKNVVVLNTDEIARRIGSPKSSNVVLLGAASKYLKIPYENLENGIRTLFYRKGDNVINKNLEALKAGMEFVSA